MDGFFDDLENLHDIRTTAEALPATPTPVKPTKAQDSTIQSIDENFAQLRQYARRQNRVVLDRSYNLKQAILEEVITKAAKWVINNQERLQSLWHTLDALRESRHNPLALIKPTLRMEYEIKFNHLT